MAGLEQWMAPFFAKLPHLPPNARQTIVTIAPMLALIFGILGLFVILTGGVIASLLSIVSIVMLADGLRPLLLLIALLAGGIAAALDLLAYKPLAARKKKGWNYLFYGTVLTTCSAILEVVFGAGTLGSIIGALLGFWLLFEVRGLYQ